MRTRTILALCSAALLLLGAVGVASAQFVNEQISDNNLATTWQKHYASGGETIDLIDDIPGDGVRFVVSTDVTSGEFKIGIAEDYPIDSGNYGFDPCSWHGSYADWSPYTAYQLMIVNNSTAAQNNWFYAKVYFTTAPSWINRSGTEAWLAPGETLVSTVYFAGATEIDAVTNFGFEVMTDYGTGDYEGTGFDVIVTPVIAAPSEVYVDDDWGTPPSDPGQPVGAGPYIFGYDAFDNIQDGLDGVEGSTVNVAAGTYNEQVRFSKGATVVGTGTVLIDPNGAQFEGPKAGADWVRSAVTFETGSSGATLDNVTIQNTNASDLNGNAGIEVIDGNIDNVTIQNVIVNGVSGQGFGSYDTDYTWPPPAGWLIDNCQFSTSATNTWSGMRPQNMDDLTIQYCDIGPTNYGGILLINTSTSAVVKHNTVHNTVRAGIQVDSYCTETVDILCNEVYATNSASAADYGDVRLYGQYSPDPHGGAAATVTIQDNFLHDGYNGVCVKNGQDISTRTVTVQRNCITGHSNYGGYNGGTGTLNAENNYWGAGDGPGGVGPGSGDPVSANVDYDPWIGTATGNIVFVPDPEYFSALTGAGSERTFTVRYLGGACGPIHSWEILIDRDDTIVSTQAANVDYAASGPFASGGTAILTYENHPTENKVIVSATLTTGDAYCGACDLFQVQYSAVAEGVKDVSIEVDYFRSGPFASDDIDGAYGDPGEMRVDLTNPAVTVVTFTNETLTHVGGDDWAKYLDNGNLTARVVEADPYMAITDFEADLSGLGLGASVNPDSYSYDGGNGWYDLTWNTFQVINNTSETALKTLTVTATDGAGHFGSGNDTVTLDNEAPAAPTSLSAAPGHQETTLGWTHGTDAGQYDGTIVVYTTPYGTYPEFDRPNWPPTLGPDPTLASNEGTAYDWGTGTSQVHSITPRNVYRYAAFGRDMARNYSAASSMADATNYWLGDVAAGYNGLVNTGDISLLGSNYYQHLIDDSFNHECDVAQESAPQNPLGIPAPDMMVDFEDLMIFALNFGNVSPLHVPAAVSVDSKVGDVALYLQLPDELAVGSEFTAVAMLKDESGLVQGTHFRVAYDSGVLEFVEASEGALVSGCGAAFFKALEVEELPDVSAAALGAGITFGHSGELARLTFRVVGEGAIRLELQNVNARNVLNEELLMYSSDVLVEGGGSQAIIPTHVYLCRNQPNPFTGATMIAFGLPQEGLVRLAIYDVSGRLVRTLINGALPAAEHVLSWDRRDESGHAVSGGVYLYRLETSEKTITRKMVVSN